MNLEELMREDDAVSPVIGVILMVAITVILAAVIASFVLGMGPDTATTPSATFDSEENAAGDVLTITMENGQALDPAKIYIRGDIATGTGQVDNSDGESWADSDASPGSEITAGDSVQVGFSGDYTIRLIYEDGDTSSTMRTFES